MTSLRQKVEDARRRAAAGRSPLDGRRILAETEDVAALLGAIDELRAMHVPAEEGFGRPTRCHSDGYDWPCPSQRAMAGAV